MNAKTMPEKIIGSHVGEPVSAGEVVIAKIDYCFTHDSSGPLTIKQLKEVAGGKLADPKRTIFFIDHAIPSPRKELSNDHQNIRKFAKETNCQFSEAGRGICHQVLAEEYASPGELIIGTDSHTVTAGALGAFATGMGATDVAVCMALGETWLRVPETRRIEVNGELPKGVYSKDIILKVIGMLGSDGATYETLEFVGSAISRLPIHERLTLTNMSVEAGAKTGLIPTDERTRDYLKKQGRGDKFKEIKSDEGAKFLDTIKLDASSLEPVVACPHTIDNVKPVREVRDVEVDMVFIGSCTNARLEDLQVAAKILKGEKPKTRLVVTPASSKVYLQAVADGTIQTFLELGAAITTPGCGMCFGALGGVPGDGEVVVATTNRNFQGRMGNPNAYTYLGSPALAAATAIEGKIADPREYL